MARTDEFPAREVAFPGRETADADGARTFTEEEHRAIVAATVASELASKDEKIAELEGQVATLTQEKAEAIDRADLAETAKEAAERELADYKAEVEQAKLVEGRKDERVKRMRRILPDKPDEFFAERAQAWAEKSDEDFDAYAKEMAEVAGVTEGADDRPPRETSMRGSPVAPPKAGEATSKFHSLLRKGA